tara:strand:- start:360 stop:659 length:300 start_codon:yes stop_codon:yes gene_type:complete
MKTIIKLLPLLLIFSCIPQEEYGRISYQVESDTLLPLIVLIDGKIIDSIQTKGDWDCEHTDEYIFVPTPYIGEVVIKGDNYNDTFNVVVTKESCTFIEI